MHTNGIITLHIYYTTLVKFKRSNKIHRIQGRQKEFDKTRFGNKIRQFKAMAKVKMVYKFHHKYEYHLSWTSSMDIFLGGSNDIQGQLHKK